MLDVLQWIGRRAGIPEGLGLKCGLGAYELTVTVTRRKSPSRALGAAGEAGGELEAPTLGRRIGDGNDEVLFHSGNVGETAGKRHRDISGRATAGVAG